MYINNVKFAKNAENHLATIDLAHCKRLQEIDKFSGTLNYAIEGYVDGSNRPALRLKIYGIIHALCQNCLQPITIKINNQSEITIFYTDKELDAALFEDNDSGVQDGILAEEEFDVIKLVEDEIIMLIPYAIKHKSCQRLIYEDEIDNPFKILKDII